MDSEYLSSFVLPIKPVVGFEGGQTHRPFNCPPNIQHPSRETSPPAVATYAADGGNGAPRGFLLPPRGVVRDGDGGAAGNVAHLPCSLKCAADWSPSCSSSIPSEGLSSLRRFSMRLPFVLPAPPPETAVAPSGELLRGKGIAGLLNVSGCVGSGGVASGDGPPGEKLLLPAVCMPPLSRFSPSAPLPPHWSHTRGDTCNCGDNTVRPTAPPHGSQQGLHTCTVAQEQWQQQQQQQGDEQGQSSDLSYASDAFFQTVSVTALPLAMPRIGTFLGHHRGPCQIGHMHASMSPPSHHRTEHCVLFSSDHAALSPFV